STVTFTDSGLEVGATYTYQVRAYNGAGNSGYSNTAGTATLSAPVAPSNLIATALTGGRASLRWTDNSTNEAGFRIEMRVGNGAFREIGTTRTDVRTSSVSGLTPGTSYTFRVR